MHVCSYKHTKCIRQEVCGQAGEARGRWQICYRWGQERVAVLRGPLIYACLAISQIGAGPVRGVEQAV